MGGRSQTEYQQNTTGKALMGSKTRTELEYIDSLDSSSRNSAKKESLGIIPEEEEEYDEINYSTRKQESVGIEEERKESLSPRSSPRSSPRIRVQTSVEKSEPSSSSRSKHSSIPPIKLSNEMSEFRGEKRANTLLNVEDHSFFDSQEDQKDKQLLKNRKSQFLNMKHSFQDRKENMQMIHFQKKKLDN